MILLLSSHFDLFFCLLNRLKFDLDEVDKAMFKVLLWHIELIICSLTSR